MRKVSNKMRAKLSQYTSLVKELRELCGNRSELSGNQSDWRTEFNVEPHHITGRGKHLLNPFSIIMVTRAEHDEQDSNNFEAKQKLLEYIKPKRLRQGYKENDDSHIYNG